jgi:hypothetical protein
MAKAPITFASMALSHAKMVEAGLKDGLTVGPEHVQVLVEIVKAQSVEIARLANALRGAKDDASRLRYPDTTGQ